MEGRGGKKDGYERVAGINWVFKENTCGRRRKVRTNQVTMDRFRPRFFHNPFLFKCYYFSIKLILLCRNCRNWIVDEADRFRFNESIYIFFFTEFETTPFHPRPEQKQERSSNNMKITEGQDDRGELVLGSNGLKRERETSRGTFGGQKRLRRWKICLETWGSQRLRIGCMIKSRKNFWA